MTLAWPFVVSRNRAFDYRTIVAPAFLVQAHSEGLLAEYAGGSLSSAGEARIRSLFPNDQIGWLTLVYRVLLADRAFLEPGCAGPLLDAPGREIFWIEGVILRGPPRPQRWGDALLREAHRQIVQLPLRQEYWNMEDILSFRALCAEPIEADAQAGPPLELISEAAVVK